MYQKLLSTLTIASALLLGSVSAVTTPGLERQACIVSDEVYAQLTTMQMQYAAELAADHFDAAQAIYDSMQSQLTTACGNTDGIVSLQTAGQSAQCITQINALLAHYKYNIQLGRQGIAAAIQQNIQQYLDDSDCDELAASGTGADTGALDALLQATISQIPDVIPYNKNICFLDNTVDNFVEQINNIAEQNILQSVDAVV